MEQRMREMESESLQRVEEAVGGVKRENEELKETVEILGGEKRELLEVSERKSGLIEQLRAQSLVNELRGEKEKYEMSFSDLSIQSETFNIQRSGMKKEIEGLKKQLEEAQEEYEKKVFEYQEFRKNKGKNEQMREQVRMLERELERFKENDERNSKMILGLQNELKKTRDNFVETEESLKLELDGLKRLNELQQQSIEDLNKRLGEYEEMEKNEVLKEQEREYVEATPSHAMIEQGEFRTPQVNQNSFNIQTPRIAGKSMTEIYHEYSKMTEELSKERIENERLREELKEILEQVESKARLMEQMSDDNERVHKGHEMLIKEYEKVMSERNVLRGRMNEVEKEMKMIMMDREALEKINKDLSNQVQTLLMDSCVVPEMSESDSVSGRMVVFKNIQELQMKNQELLKVIRMMNVEKEKNKRQEEIEAMQRELSELREARSRQQEMVMSIVKQRDSYKEIIDGLNRRGQRERGEERGYQVGDERRYQGGDDNINGNTSSSPYNPHSQFNPNAQFNSNTQFNPHNNFDEEYQMKCKNILNEQENKLNELNKENSELRIKLGKNQAQGEFYKERYELLNENVKNQIKENEDLRRSNLEMSSNLLNYQQKI
ncbi:hypothetical protein O9G_005993, partial [Rozella allomycis CSF55]